MVQNTSHAVMAQRKESKDSLDDFPTPPWATRALIKHVLVPNLIVPNPELHLSATRAWEPACNRGHMAMALKETFDYVHTSDVINYGWAGHEITMDFLADSVWPKKFPGWIITNPPFNKAMHFVVKALLIPDVEGVAVLLRTSALEGQARYRGVYSARPPSIIAQFVERVPMVKGRIDAKASTATAYMWMVWSDLLPSRFMWIPPCRKQLEMPGDYAEFAKWP